MDSRGDGRKIEYLMAEKLNISRNGYVKIERGEVRLSVDRLIQLANVFQIDIADLIKNDHGAMIFVTGNNNNNGGGIFNYYNNTAGLVAENEKLKLIIAHKDELITQQKSEIDTLKLLVNTLRQKNPH